MMVVMTMWLPRVACSQAGMKAQAAPKAKAAIAPRRPFAHQGRLVSKARQTSADAEAAEIGLTLAADIEQAAVEGDRDRKAGEDEIGRVIEREAEALAIAERAVDHQAHRLEGILADEQDDQPGKQERRREVEQGEQADSRPSAEAGRPGRSSPTPCPLRWTACCGRAPRLILPPRGRRCRPSSGRGRSRWHRDRARRRCGRRT